SALCFRGIRVGRLALQNSLRAGCGNGFEIIYLLRVQLNLSFHEGGRVTTRSVNPAPAANPCKAVGYCGAIQVEFALLAGDGDCVFSEFGSGFGGLILAKSRIPEFLELTGEDAEILDALHCPGVTF